MITVILVKNKFYEPESIVSLTKISDDLTTMQNIVGGMIEIYQMQMESKELEDIICILDGEGKLKNYNPTIRLKHDIIVGDCFFARRSGAEIVSLLPSDVDKIVDYLTNKDSGALIMNH